MSCARSLGTSRIDVAVVGAGPAGLASAIALRQRGCSVLVLERRPNYHARRVGEHLPPYGIHLLNQLGAMDVVRSGPHIRCPGIESHWFADKVVYEDYMFSPYSSSGLNLSRNVFEQQLSEVAISKGVELQFASRAGEAQRTQDGWLMQTRFGTVHATILVDATGLAASVARANGSQRVVDDSMIAICQYSPSIQSGSASCRSNAIRIEPDSFGWWYSAPLNGCCSVNYFTDRESVPSHHSPADFFRRRLQRTKHILRAGCRFNESDVFARPVVSGVLDRLVGDDWVAVGDAACVYDPLSSLGLSKSLSNGLSVADHICRRLNGESDSLQVFAEELREDYKRYRALRYDYYSFAAGFDAGFRERRTRRHAADSDSAMTHARMDAS